MTGTEPFPDFDPKYMGDLGSPPRRTYYQGFDLSSSDITDYEDSLKRAVNERSRLSRFLPIIYERPAFDESRSFLDKQDAASAEGQEGRSRSARRCIGWPPKDLRSWAAGIHGGFLGDAVARRRSLWMFLLIIAIIAGLAALVVSQAASAQAQPYI